MATYGYAAYKEARVNTASQKNLLLMLYDGAISNLKQAITALESKDYGEAHRLLIKTQDILSELMSSLNMEIEVAHSLYSLYEYSYQRLVAANVSKEVEPVHEVIGYLMELREAWNEAGQVAPTGETGGVNEEAVGSQGVEITG